MSKKIARATRDTRPAGAGGGYDTVLHDVAGLLESARRTAARTINAVMTATYWEIGRRIVELEQGGTPRAGYGESLLARLSLDLTAKFGRGFGVDNLQRFRAFFLAYPREMIYATPSRQSEDVNPPLTAASEKHATPSRESSTRGAPFSISRIAARFPLPWSSYVRLLSVDKPEARAFYEAEALRCGWSVRQLDRQISTLFYERTLLSKNKAAILRKAERPRPEDTVTAEEETRDPYVLEFLDLKDEYSESELEQALIRQLESFLLELGGDFAFVGRQRRLRIGDEWYHVDLCHHG